MTDAQLYILVAIPLLAIVTNTAVQIHLGARIEAQGARIDALTTSMNTRFDMLTGKLSKLDSRLAVLEDRHAR